MTVYVDDMRMPARVGSVQGVWSHMMADTREELDAMARRIGLRTAWRQDKRSGVHYDVVESRRAAAVAAGAVEIECGSGQWVKVRAVACSQYGHSLTSASLVARARQARQRPAGTVARFDATSG